MLYALCFDNKASLLHPGLNNEEYQVVIGNDTTRYIIDDLEPARNYTFYIVAYMPMGASRMSDHIIQHTLEDGEFIHVSSRIIRVCCGSNIQKHDSETSRFQS